MKILLNSLMMAVLLLAGLPVAAQSVSDKYSFTTDTLASLEKTMTGAPLDMSGAAVVLTDGLVNRFSDEIRIAEPIWFMGKQYTRFFIHSSGLVVLADGTAPLNFAAAVDNSLQLYSAYGFWAPFWDKQRVKGEVKYQQSGTFPDRVFVIDWKTKLPDHTQGNAPDCHYQVRFYESTGTLEYVYGNMQVGVGADAPVTATIGFSINAASANNTFLHLSDLDSFSVNRLMTGLVNNNNLVNSDTAGDIRGLHTAVDTVCRRFLFTPALPLAPTNLAPFNTGRTDVLLYWTDNAQDEVAYRIYRASGSPFREVGVTVQDLNFSFEQGLRPNRRYNYMVAAQNSVGVSYSNMISFTSLAPSVSIAKQSGNWSDSSTWLDERVPAADDSVYVSGGYQVVIDTSSALCYSLAIDTGSVVFEETAAARSLVVTGDLSLTSHGTLTGPASLLLNNITPQIKVGRDLVNNGQLNLYLTDGTYTWASALEFNGEGQSRFAGNGHNDLFLLKVNKSRLEDTVWVQPDSLVVAGSGIDSVSNRGFFQSNGMIGTLVLAGDFSLENRLFSVGAYDIPANGAVVLDNDSLVVSGQANNTTLNGALEIRRGIFNHGKDIAYNLTFNSTSVFIVRGGEVNLNGRSYGSTRSFELYGGTLNIGKFVNTLTTPTFAPNSTNGIVKLIGGKIVMKQPGTSPSRVDYRLYGINAQSTIGNTELFFDGDSGSIYYVGGYAPHMTVDSIAGGNHGQSLRLIAEFNVKGQMELPVDSRIDLNNFRLTMSGDTNLVNGIIEGTSQVAFTGNGHQVVSGSGKLRSYGLEFNGDMPLNNVDIQSDTLLYASNMLALRQGSVTNTQRITLGNGSNALAIEYGAAGLLLNAGDFDSLPQINLGTGTLSIAYLDQLADRVTGAEIPASRTVHNITVNTNKIVRVAGGDVHVGNVLTLQKGKVYSKPGNELVLENGNSTAVGSGTITSYVNGTIKRKINGNQNNTSGYFFPVGDINFTRTELVNLRIQSDSVYVRAGYRDTTITATLASDINTLENKYWFFETENAVPNLVSGQIKFYDLNPGGFKNISRAITSTHTPSLADTFVAGGYRGASFADRSFYYSDTLSNLHDTAVQVFAIANTVADVIANDTFYVGKGHDLLNLTAIAAKLRSSVLAGNVWFLITNDYTDTEELFPVVFDTMAYAGAKYKIYIGLDRNVSVKRTGNVAQILPAGTGLIYLNGIDSIEFNGEGYDATGKKTGQREWTFLTEANTTNVPVFTVLNDATDVTLKGLELKGNANLASSATVLLQTSSAPVTGNDRFMAAQCLFTSGTTYPQNHFLTSGINANRTDAVTLRDNDFTNITIAAILVPAQTAGTNWLISGNHFYDEANLSNNNRKAIDFKPGIGSHSHDISGNYFGGNTRFAGGTTFVQAAAVVSVVMDLDVDAAIPTLVQGNVIKNYTQTSASTAAYWIGIRANAGNYIVSGNQVGGHSSTDQVNIAGLGASIGIQVAGNTSTYLVTGNEISYMRHTLASANQSLTGIEGRGALSSFKITNNRIHHLESQCTKLVIGYSGLNGIYLQGSNQSEAALIQGNDIYNIGALNPSTISFISVEGMRSGTIDGNLMRDFYYTTSLATVGTIVGVNVQYGSWLVTNNMVNLSNRNYPDRVIALYGMRFANASLNSQMYNNTLLQSAKTRNTNSYSIACIGTNVPLDVRNNIVINTQEITGSFGAYALYGYNNPAFFEVNNNAYFVKDTAKWFYNPSTGNVPFSAYRTSYPAYDSSSLFQYYPAFADTLTDLHLRDTAHNWPLKAAGLALTTSDFDGDMRHMVQNDIGADEFVLPMLDVPLFVSGNDTLCAGEGRTLIAANPNSSGKVEWYATASSTDTLATGDTLHLVEIRQDTVLYLQVQDDTSRSYRVAVPVKVVEIPSLSLVNLPADTLCMGTSLALELGMQAGVNTIRWYADTALQQQIASGWILNTGALTHDTTFYYIYETASCLSDTQRVSIAVNPDSILAAPSLATPVSTCKGGDVVLQPVAGGEIRWYATMNAQVPFLSDTAIFIQGLLADSTVYVETFNGSCISNRVALTVTTDSIPQPPVTDTAITVCMGTIATLQASGSGVHWYADDTTTISLLAGNTFATAAVNADTVFYVANESATCKSSRIKVSVIPYQVASPMKAAAPAVCYGATAELKAFAIAGEIAWYADRSLNTLLTKDTLLILPALTADKTVYLRVIDGQCLSAVDSMTVSVGLQPAIPVVTGHGSVCFGTADTLMAQSAGSVNWYETAFSSNPYTAGISFTTPPVTKTTVWYAQADFGNGCLSARVPFTVQPIALAQPPLFDSIASICRGDSAILKPLISGGMLSWYSSIASPSPLAVDSQLVTGPVNINTTYYVQSFDGQCYSNRIPVRVTVRSTPANPQILVSDPVCINRMAVLKVKTTGNTQARWYADLAGQQQLAADTILYTSALAADTVFYVQAYDGVCAGNIIAYPVMVLDYLSNVDFSIPDSIAINTATDFSTQGASTNLYNWSFGSGATTGNASGMGPFTISWTTEGTKTVRLFVQRTAGATTCDTTITRTIRVYDPNKPGVSVGEFSVGNTRIYPNPAYNVLYLDIPAAAQAEVKVTLLDISGKSITTQLVSGAAPQAIDVSQLAPGTYLIRLQLQQEVINFKFIKNQ